MAEHTPGPWEFIPSTDHHGPYVIGPAGGDVCDCYTMSNLMAASVRNGGQSYPIAFQGESADANALLISAAPDLVAALKALDAALCDGFETQVARMNVRKALVAARAAIAKSEGR